MKKLVLLPFLVSMSIFNIFGQWKERDKLEKEFNEIKAKIYPIIKVEITSQDEKPVKLTEENHPVFKKIAGDLLCFYGIDNATSFTLLTKRDIPDNLSIDQLDKISKENLLTSIEKDLKLHTANFGGLGFTCGGNHEAALILLPEIWDVLTDKLSDNIIFVVPSKDVCIFVNEEKKDNIKNLQKLINEIHKDGDHLLSNKLFRYNGGKIEVFGE